MSEFNPGDNWRKYKVVPGPQVDESVIYVAPNGDRHVWVREKPSPPLPTEVVDAVLSRLRATGRTTLGDAIREADLS